MYLLYLDESGTHGGSPCLVLAGLAIHENDAWHLQRRLELVLARKLPKGLAPRDFELHAAEMKTPVRVVKGVRKVSPWAQVPLGRRLDIIDAAYRAVANYRCLDKTRPCVMFGAVIDRSYADKEQRAYEEVLHRFDELLTRQGHTAGSHERGLVIHDRRVIERDVQAWTANWRQVAGRIGTLTHLVDVPVFADSRASRLIQAADFVAWSLWRYYGPSDDESRVGQLWTNFDADGGVMHGLVHVAPGFRQGACACPPCASRLASAPR